MSKFDIASLSKELQSLQTVYKPMSALYVGNWEILKIIQ